MGLPSFRPLDDELYQHIMQVSRRKKPADMWFKSVRWLNVYTGQVQSGHIYIARNRIAYIGEQEPLTDESTEVVTLEEHQLLVPGYIEPHAHPFQWYNPLSLANHLLQQGTTVSVNDNLFLLAALSDEEALSFMEELDRLGHHLWLWWARLDGQTQAGHREKRYHEHDMERWLKHPLVIQGGELTSWPLLVHGDPDLTHWMNRTRHDFGKRIEGHLPGASAETLNALAAAGISADHEAMSGEDVLRRLRLGMYATLRYSSIRPDLPHILSELWESPELNLSRLMLTNDGSSPFFMHDSGQDQLLKIVMDAGIPAPEAYRMATLNPAVYYGLDQDVGGIAPGRLAHLNVLDSLVEPKPRHVLVNGCWVVQNRQSVHGQEDQSWLTRYFKRMHMSWQPQVSMLHEKQQQQAGEVGVEMVNEVITRPYRYDPTSPLKKDECYLTLLDREGSWCLNTRLKGFARDLEGLASTYTVSRDFLLIGKDRSRMIEALQEAVGLGGGVVAYGKGQEKWSVSLPLGGGMSLCTMNELHDTGNRFVQLMARNGYVYQDPIYSLLFLTATHLPFIRVTKEGLFLVKEREVIRPIRHTDHMKFREE